MKKTYTFQRNKVLLNVGGHKFTTSLPTLTSVPDTYLDSMFSGRHILAPDDDDGGAYFIDRSGTHFEHILNHLRDPGSFTLSQALTGNARAELAVELQFYGLLDRVMPYHAQEQIGAALLRAASSTGTRRALQQAVAQARALVFEMGSTTPWLTEDFQDARYVITDRVVNGAPVWAAEDGEWFVMYCDVLGRMWVTEDNEDDAPEGTPCGVMINTECTFSHVMAPTQLPADKWRSCDRTTMEPQHTSAGGTEAGNPWVGVPDMRVTAVHGLDDADPAMAAALRQLAALTGDE
jgi:hypothetical protein